MPKTVLKTTASLGASASKTTRRIELTNTFLGPKKPRLKSNEELQLEASLGDKRLRLAAADLKLRPEASVTVAFNLKLPERVVAALDRIVAERNEEFCKKFPEGVKTNQLRIFWTRQQELSLILLKMFEDEEA